MRSLVVLLPAVVVLTGQAGTVSMLVGEGLPIAGAASIGIMLLLGLIVGVVLQKLNVAAPLLLGGTIVSALGHGTGSIDGVMPPAIATAGLVLIGLFFWCYKEAVADSGVQTTAAGWSKWLLDPRSDIVAALLLGIAAEAWSYRAVFVVGATAAAGGLGVLASLGGSRAQSFGSPS